MGDKNSKHDVKQRIEEPLQTIRMSEAEKDQVMQRIREQRVEKKSIWEREVTLSIPVAALAFIVVIGISSWTILQSPGEPFIREQLVNETVEFETGVFNVQDLERLLNR